MVPLDDANILPSHTSEASENCASQSLFFSNFVDSPRRSVLELMFVDLFLQTINSLMWTGVEH